MLDISGIEHLFLKENYLLALGLPQGYIFARVKRLERVPYIYSEASAMAADAYNTEAELGISARNVTNFLTILTHNNQLYQAFYGIRPSPIRMYLGYPVEQPARRIEVAARLTKSLFGGVDGYDSPYDQPSPLTEVWIPYKLSVGFALHNPTNDTLTPVVRFYLLRYEVEWIKDVDLVVRILERRVEARFATLGGLSDALDYPVEQLIGLKPIRLGAKQPDVLQMLR